MMKRNMLKTWLVLALLMLCLTLTGCYREMDPWPASTYDTLMPDPTATSVVTADSTMIPAAPLQTQEPAVQPADAQEEEIDFWADEATPVPGGSVEPGANG